MKYFYIDGYHLPKHCIYGPRPNEGVVFTETEWRRVNDRLVLREKEKIAAENFIEKEEAKKRFSNNTTETWQNTLGSIKALGDQKRLEKIEKDKREKIEKYNEIMENRKREKEKVLDKARKILYQEKDFAKEIESGLFYSSVIDERNKQIEFKNLLMKKKKKEEEKHLLEMRKGSEMFNQEKLEAEMKKKEKQKSYRKTLDQQVSKLKEKSNEKEEIEKEKRDLNNMKIEIEKTKECEKEFLKRKRLARKLNERGSKQLELKKQLSLEEEQETELNGIYSDFAKQFYKGRIDGEKEKIKSFVETRTKIAEKIAKGIGGRNKEFKEEQKKEGEKEEEDPSKEERDEKERIKRELVEAKKEAEEKIRKENLKKREESKWETIQRYRREEINREQEEFTKMLIRKNKKEMKDCLLDQWKRDEIRKLEEGERQISNLDENKHSEQLLKDCQRALEYTKQHNKPIYPVLATITKLKKENNLLEKTRKADDEEAEKESSNQKKPQFGPLGIPCHSFKY